MIFFKQKMKNGKEEKDVRKLKNRENRIENKKKQIKEKEKRKKKEE